MGCDFGKKGVFITITTIAAVIIVTAVITMICVFTIGRSKKNSNRPFGVWWWDNRLDRTYMDFAAENGINEIYLYASDFTDRITQFITDASAKDMKVFWLAGKYEWIEDDASLIDLMNKFVAYQKGNQSQFHGVHFDIEPHQHPEFETRRQELITAFVSLTGKLKKSYPDVFIEYDLPFWLEDEITFDGKTKPAYAHVIDNAARVTMMSYRDKAEDIYDVAKEEIEYAINTSKTLNLGVETGENSDEFITFYGKGKKYMNKQLDIVRDMIPENFGTVIHHIKTWREL